MNRKQQVIRTMLIVNDIKRNIVDVELPFASLEPCKISVNEIKNTYFPNYVI